MKTIRGSEYREKLVDFFKHHLCLPEDVPMDRVLSVCTVMKVPKGECLIRQGELPQYIYFNIRGVLRGMVLDADGRDITDCIVSQCGQPIVADNEFSQPASTGIEALEECEVVRVSVKDVMMLLNDYPSLFKTYQTMLVAAADFHRMLKIAVYQYPAPKRYEWFLQHFPGLIDRIPHKYIASFLNITPVTLSKVRRRVKEAEEA